MADNTNTTGTEEVTIRQLIGEERLRDRPEVMLGTSDVEGARHCVAEIIGNGLDEINSGYGDRLIVRYHEDGSVSIRDFGRGVPMGWNEEFHKYNWDLIFNELYAGGKYGDGQEVLSEITDWSRVTWDLLKKKINYLFSIGLNGLGAASTQYTSEYFNVESYKDGQCTRMEFKKGKPALKEAIITPTDEPNGTLIHWKPDIEVFSDINIGGDWLYDFCSDTLCTAGVKLDFYDETRGIEVHEDGSGLQGVVNKYFKGYASKVSEDGMVQGFPITNFVHGNTYHRGKDKVYVCYIEALLVPLSQSKSTPFYCYHNSIATKTGSQYDGIRNAVVDFFRDISAEKGVRIDIEDYRGLFGVVLNSFSNIADFKGQTKHEVRNDFINTAVYDCVYQKLKAEYGKGNKEIKNIVETVTQNAVTRIQIKEYAKQVRAANRVKRDKPDSKYFTSCMTYEDGDIEHTEVWFAEGESAGGALRDARFSQFQAILQLRGKFLNVRKASIDKILKNDIVKRIFAVMGTGMNLGHENLFDINKLKSHKFIIATDADKDGFHIRVLIFLVFYVLAPEVLENGMLYIAQPPLYSIKLRDNTVRYAMNAEERDAIIKEVGSGAIQNGGINRFKGLGECNADILRETTMAPETRNLVQIKLTPGDMDIERVVGVLFGEDESRERKDVLGAVLGSDFGDNMDETFSLMQQIDSSDIETGIDYVMVS